MNTAQSTPNSDSLNILVVEDNDDLREATIEVLSAMGHRVHGVDCAEAVPEQEGGRTIDLAVIDLNLPGEDGLRLAQRLRRVQPGIGIIMVTARSAMPDRLAGYQHGADQYLAKPTDPQELRAAVQALARRLQLPERRTALPRLDIQAFTLSMAGGFQIHLTPPETALLAALSRAADQRMENWRIMAVLGTSNALDRKAALEIAIVRLRKKLHRAGVAEHAIQAIRGWGYQLCLRLVVQNS